MSSTPLKTEPDQALPHTAETAPIRLFVLAVTALAAGIALSCILEGNGPKPFTGTLQATTTCVTADRPGRLIGFQVQEGAAVTIGSPLVSLADRDLAERIASQERTVDQLTVELNRAKASAELDVAWRVKEINQDITDLQLRSAGFLKDKFDHELQQTMLADVLASGDTALFNAGNEAFESFILGDQLPRQQRIKTTLDMERTANAVEVFSTQIECCDQRLQSLQSQLKDIPGQVRRAAGVDVAETRLELARQELERLKTCESEMTVVSPAIGTVGVFRRSTGDHVEPGTPIVDLLDDARRFLVVDVPSADVTEFSIGRKLSLQFPGQVAREGRVFRIAPQAEPGTRPGHEGDAVVAVHVEQTGEVWPSLPIGSQVEVKLASE